MATNPIIRSHLSFTELMVHWQCSENDLRDAIVSQRLVPSIHVNGAVWVFNASGKRTQDDPAIFVNEMMYLVGIAQLGASDCAFNFYCREPNVLRASSLFKDARNGYVDTRKRMADVEKDGRFMPVEVDRAKTIYEAMTARASTPSAADKNLWWKTKHNVTELANEVKAVWVSEGREVIQSGSRHGQYSRSAIGEAVAKKIEEAEKVNKTNGTIGGKSISNYLKECNWS